MSTEITFPLALCKAQWSIWLHALEMLETIGSSALQRGIEETRAGTDAVMRAEDWPALAMAPMRVLRPQEPDRPAHVPAAAAHQAAPAQLSRKAVVSEALRTLHGALASAPSAHRVNAGRKAATARRRA